MVVSELVGSRFVFMDGVMGDEISTSIELRGEWTEMCTSNQTHLLLATLVQPEVHAPN